MSLALTILGALALLVGFIGCVVPLIPGPFVGFCGLLCLLLTPRPPSTAMLVVMGVLVAVVTVVDYVVPAMGAKKFHCTRWGTTGCFIGTIVGMFFLPLGLVLGPFLGAFVGELVAGRTADAAARGGFGALLGFLSGVFIKFLVCVCMAAYFVMCVM